VPHIALVGPGSVGTFFAAHLAATGADIVACARRPFTEYVVESPEAPVRAPAAVLTDPDEVTGPADWLLVAVKAHQTEGAVPWLHRLWAPHTVVVAIQNGVEGVERMRRHLPEAEVLAAVVYCGAELVAPGHIRHAARGDLILPDEPVAHRFAELFSATPARIVPSADYVTEAWRKLGLNVVVNGLTALTLRTMEVMRRDDMAAVGRAILSEAWAVGAAEGARLGPDDVDTVVAGFARFAEGGGTSMLYDRRAGRATEHDALYGAVLRAGRRHGIPTPTNEIIAAIVAAGDPPADGG
jgi:2-dehydropantoate 2-reductase